MSTYTIDKFTSPSGDVYKFKDKISGFTTNTGTVTSVGVSGGTGISVSGSPITTSGSITVTNTGVTGVKGSSESSYRTGQVNLTAANIGAVNLTGDTMTGNLITPATRIANTYYGITFGRTTATPVETILYTGIKWRSGSHMPVIHITGYAYGLTSPVEFKIGFYIYNNTIGWSGVTNMGAWQPTVYLFKYTKEEVEYVAVGLAGRCYFLQLQADVQDEMGKFLYIVTDSSAWSWTFSTETGVIPEPDAGVTCIQVPYKADILNPSQVNGHTVNKDVPSNAVFTDTTYESKSAASGGTALSLVTTGEKYTWNNKSKISAWTTNTPTAVTKKTVVTGVTPATVVTGGTKTAIPNISKKTVVTSVTPATVVTGGNTTAITPVSSKTVVTSASGATSVYSSGVLTLTNGSFSTGASVTTGTAINAYTSLSTGKSATVNTGDSVTVGTAIEAYTGLTTGASATVTTGDSVTVTAGKAATLTYT